MSECAATVLVRILRLSCTYSIVCQKTCLNQFKSIREQSLLKLHLKLLNGCIRHSWDRQDVSIILQRGVTGVKTYAMRTIPINHTLSTALEQPYGNCSFTANLYIRNPTYKDSGNYTVEAVGTGNSSCAMYELDIVRKPSIICTQHSIVPGDKIDCTIHNYSAFIDVVVVKNDVTEFEKYPASEKCRPIVLNQVTAKCSIKFEDLGRFSVCVNYSSSVITNETLHQCTGHIHVETFFAKRKLPMFLT
ncbi:hypothetical protein GBAR_LOCUS20768 [Geodia barretti]|uniref:Uncharacterized protein n=1 Tax=Geodia barretti TaxID=519541 RepID=A0AA35SY12_GEOBA|nr:hypothetical protein GBAR_LOCUS20768 [Geodia barretti]